MRYTDIDRATFSERELAEAFGFGRYAIRNWTRPQFGYLPDREGQRMDVAYAIQVYALAKFIELGLAGPSAKDAAAAVAPVMMKWLKGHVRPKLVFVSSGGRIIPVPKQLDKLPVHGPIGIVVDLQYAATVVRDRLQDIVKERKWQV
jgi:hypothetical protein